MKRILMVAVLAASTFGLAGAALASEVIDETRATTVVLAGSSDGSFIKQQSAQYNADGGE